MMKRVIGGALAVLLASGALAGPHDKPGFATFVEEGRLWVFKDGSKELADFKASGEPAKQFTDIGTGPNGMTVKAADEATLREYIQLLKK